MHAALDFLNHFGRVFSHNTVNRCLGFREYLNSGILVHQRQYCPDGVNRHRRSSPDSPTYPVHAYVGMGYAVYGVCFYRVAQVGKLSPQLFGLQVRAGGLVFR